jgi:phosphoglycerol transferase MdoB-like AlkP superfamily enzyme
MHLCGAGTGLTNAGDRINILINKRPTESSSCVKRHVLRLFVILNVAKDLYFGMFKTLRFALSDNFHTVCHSLLSPDLGVNKLNRKQIIKPALTIATMIILSVIIMIITFGFSSATLNISLFKSYFKQGMLVFMNFIPIFLLMCFIYLMSNRLWLAYLSTALIFTAIGIVNKLKLTYRDDPFTFVDIKLVRESLKMTKTYDLSLSTRVIAMILGLIGIGIILKVFFQPKIRTKNVRMTLILFLSVLSIAIFRGYYFNPEVYAELGDKEVINVWIDSQTYQSKGLVYPFIYSIRDLKAHPPQGYDKNEAKKILNKNGYKDIPDDRKINIISVMLEAYNDFSEFKDINLNVDIYEEFHKLQKESIHGKLITNVFAGDTINTERSFLTGYFTHPGYFKETNSFVRYLKEQGYRTEAMHPITGSFYNRRNINEYLGFDKYDHYDNKYNRIQGSYLMDIDFFDFIIEGFENSKKDNMPYFNFSVTYQNHGPYSDEKCSDIQYLVKKDHYDNSNYNIINNYMAGINKTDAALKKLFDYFRETEEPAIIIIFGDHNPWLGKDNSVYKMLGINLNLQDIEGFKNYYQTPYLIWGNDGAKKILGKDLKGESKTMSPNFLMSELFDCLGWEGNEYMQYITKMKERFDVNHRLYFKENNEFTTELSEENNKIWQEFKNIEYFYSNNFGK